MSDGPFKVGDIVVCVDDKPRRESMYFGASVPLRKNAIYRVTETMCCPNTGTPGLNVEDVSPLPALALASSRFRHLPKADEQFIAEMRAIRPAKNPECV